MEMREVVAMLRYGRSEALRRIGKPVTEITDEGVIIEALHVWSGSCRACLREFMTPLANMFYNTPDEVKAEYGNRPTIAFVVERADDYDQLELVIKDWHRERKHPNRAELN